MCLRRLLSRAVPLLFALTVTVTLYLYLYPVFQGCAFPLPQSNTPPSAGLSFLEKLQQNAAVNTLLQHLRGPDAAADTTQPAIFRLLVLADPQLEGDTSLPSPEDELLSRICAHWRDIQEAVDNAASTTTSFPLALLDKNVLSTFTSAIQTLAMDDVPRALRSAQKRLDLFGNDYYLAHIYRTLFWWTRPTHTTVLGDLVGSQWVTDEEYAWRGERYWTRVFLRGERVDDTLTRTGAAGDSAVENEKELLEPLGPRADPAWARRIINVAGNHDVGYAGDLSPARMERFERIFGRANWDIRFQHPPVTIKANGSSMASTKSSSADEAVVTPTLHLINLNSLALDTPALSSEVQTQSYAYLNDVISRRSYPVEDRSSFTLLLTHLPLHKEPGICTDAPHFAFHDFDDYNSPDGSPRWEKDSLREQNHLSDHVSASGVLQGIFGMSGEEDTPVSGRGRNGLILTGHDHTGCDVVHFVHRNAARETDEEQAQQSEEAGESTSAKQAWKWAASRYDSQQQHHAASSSTDDYPPSVREVTLRSMMGEFGGYAGLLSLWFDPSPDAREWKYEITMCSAGVQHIWWAVHVLLLLTLAIIPVWCWVEAVAALSGGEAKVDGTSRSVEKEKEEKKLHASKQQQQKQKQRRQQSSGT